MKQREFHQHDWGPSLDDDCRQIVRLAVREDLSRGLQLLKRFFVKWMHR